MMNKYLGTGATVRPAMVNNALLVRESNVTLPVVLEDIPTQDDELVKEDILPADAVADPMAEFRGLASCRRCPDLRLARQRAVLFALIEQRTKGGNWIPIAQVCGDIRELLAMPAEVGDKAIVRQVLDFAQWGEVEIRGVKVAVELRLTDEGRRWYRRQIELLIVT